MMMTREEYYAQIKDMYAQKYESKDKEIEAEDRRFREYLMRRNDRRFREYLMRRNDRRFREYLMRRNDDDDETDWWYRSEKENPEDQSLNDEELVETEVATELIGIEDGTVKREANAEVISAIVKKEQIPQIQVPISKLEHGLQIHNASPTVCEDSQYVVGCDELCEHQRSILQVSHVKERNVLVTESASVTINQVAHQLFDKMSFRVQSKRGQIKCHKSWRFKFKQRVATRESKSGFEVNMKHNQSKEYPCLFLAGNVATLGHIVFESEMKFNGCRMFLQLLRNVIHKKRQRKTPKYHKSWKFRFKNMDLQRIMTQLDTQHFILRWDSECILHLSTVVHHLETSHKQSSFAIDALKSDFGVDVIIFHGEQPLLWMQNNADERILIVSKLERKKKKLCYKTWMFKYKVDEEDQGILQSRTGWVQEVSAVICFLRRRQLHLHFDCEEPELAGRKRNHDLFIRVHNKLKQQRCPKSWMFKFKIDSKSARTNHILLQEKKPNEFKQVMNHTPFSVVKFGKYKDCDALLLLRPSDERFHIFETSDQCIRKRVLVSADQETEDNQLILRSFMWVIQNCLNQYMVLLLASDAYDAQFSVGVGMNKKQFRLSLRNNRVWDPGGSLVDAATPCLLSLHFTVLHFIAAILSFLKTLRSRFLQRREI